MVKVIYADDIKKEFDNFIRGKDFLIAWNWDNPNHDKIIRMILRLIGFSKKELDKK